MTLARERCRNHAHREAAARCPSCHGYFCRECVVDHAGRMLCVVCLHRISAPPAAVPVSHPKIRIFFRRTRRVLAIFLSALALWITWYGLGRVLLKIPASVHEGTVWEELGAGDGS